MSRFRLRGRRVPVSVEANLGLRRILAENGICDPDRASFEITCTQSADSPVFAERGPALPCLAVGARSQGAAPSIRLQNWHISNVELCKWFLAIMVLELSAALAPQVSSGTLCSVAICALSTVCAIFLRSTSCRFVDGRKAGSLPPGGKDTDEYSSPSSNWSTPVTTHLR